MYGIRVTRHYIHLGMIYNLLNEQKIEENNERYDTIRMVRFNFFSKLILLGGKNINNVCTRIIIDF